MLSEILIRVKPGQSLEPEVLHPRGVVSYASKVPDLSSQVSADVIVLKVLSRPKYSIEAKRLSSNSVQTFRN